MDLGDSHYGFRRRLYAAREARVVPWPALMARDAFEPLPLGKGFWRVTYQRDGRLKGCLAENEGHRFIESDMSQAVRKVEDVKP